MKKFEELNLEKDSLKVKQSVEHIVKAFEIYEESDLKEQERIRELIDIIIPD
jgi:hypothetical protein